MTERYAGSGRGGRNRLQESLRQQSRKAILDAAHALLFERPYLLVSTDDIIRKAGVSRATFYAHFESKMAIAWAVFDGVSGEWLALFDELSDGDACDPARLEAWLRRLIAVVASHGFISTMFRQLDIIDDGSHRRSDALRNELVDRLGQRLDAFSATAGDGREARRARVLAFNLLQQIDHLCAQVALKRPSVDADIQIEVMAEEMARFLGR